MLRNNPTVQGIIWMLLTTINFVMLGVMVKFLGDGLPIMQATFLRFALGLVFLIPMLGVVRELKMTQTLWRHTIGRALFQAAAMVTWFYAMTQIPLAEVTAINFMNPIFVTIGAVIIFKEKIALPRVAALCVAFVGAFIVLRPGFRALELGHFSVMVTAICLAGSYLFANSMAKKMSPAAVVFLLSISVTVILLPFAVVVWQTPTLYQLMLLFFGAFFATTAHYTMTRAFAVAPQTVVQPVVFVQLIWASLIGVFVFDESIDAYVLLGGLLIGAAVSFVTWRETKQKRDREKIPQNT